MADTVICALKDLSVGVGAAALLPGEVQVAVFRLHAADGEQLYAVDNIDPYTGAGVLSRGIVGEVDGRPTIASPLLKQRFYLDDGASLQGDNHTITTYAVRVDGEGDNAKVVVSN
ncbi:MULTISPECIES: nitrite reductase small subunit NirD [Corynebacterium]|uniref:nitrite reductase small subunit NirD n=1 Tax=Corynebacterium TaxID=1716 RepID=UPI000BAA78BE|nr:MULTISPECIES: nitrite reductase small subunit NirD [Corynebacterium]PAT07958.1 nitrite reductase (NAD(P)H) small subunit [Corynebacterium hadale]